MDNKKLMINLFRLASKSNSRIFNKEGIGFIEHLNFKNNKTMESTINYIQSSIKWQTMVKQDSCTKEGTLKWIKNHILYLNSNAKCKKL